MFTHVIDEHCIIKKTTAIDPIDGNTLVGRFIGDILSLSDYAAWYHHFCHCIKTHQVQWVTYYINNHRFIGLMCRHPCGVAVYEMECTKDMDMIEIQRRLNLAVQNQKMRSG